MNRTKFKTDDRVHYHPIIGQEHDGKVYVVSSIDKIGGQDVAWLTGKRGCVSLKALSPAPTGDPGL